MASFPPVFGTACDSVPPLNRRIIEILKPLRGQQVDRGECWDLAAKVLNETAAEWDGLYRFGRPADPWKECIFPGDIIQFEGVKLRYTEGRLTYTETMAHHTALVWEVIGPGRYILIHQNTGFSGRKVGLSDIDLKTIVKGRCTIFRPQP